MFNSYRIEKIDNGFTVTIIETIEDDGRQDSVFYVADYNEAIERLRAHFADKEA